ncbi:hypothetical protein F4678DRAFT_483867 [Xylaria arbuscula]|nr:hypothetical protein F4678DRAFT_483867 [Xylaria arbuscula]
MFGDYDKGPPVEVFAVQWDWCEHSFHNVVSLQGQLPTQSIDSVRLDENRRSPKTGKNYTISWSADHSLSNFILLAFNQSVSKGAAYSSSQLIHMDYLLYDSNLTQVVNNFATSMSNQIRSIDPGDNINVTMFPGQALYQETYFHIEWAWVSLPVAEIFSMIFLLVITIALTRKQLLLKDSVTALLFHGLKGWSEVDLQVDSPETIEKLGKHTTWMKAQLKEDDKGNLKFTRGK